MVTMCTREEWYTSFQDLEEEQTTMIACFIDHSHPIYSKALARLVEATSITDILIVVMDRIECMDIAKSFGVRGNDPIVLTALLEGSKHLGYYTPDHMKGFNNALTQLILDAEEYIHWDDDDDDDDEYDEDDDDDDDTTDRIMDVANIYLKSIGLRIVPDDDPHWMKRMNRRKRR